MKTHRLKNYLKLAILFFGIVFLFYKCEKEHFEHQQNNNGFTVKTIHSNEIAENRLLSKTLEKIRKSKTSNVSFRTVYNNHHNFYINTDEAIYIENGDYHSYTFAIYRDFQTDLTENLLLSLQVDLTYKVFIVSYDFTEAEKQLVETGQYVSLTDKAIFTPLENFDTGEITNDLSRTYYNAELDYCYELVEETSKSTGWTILVEKQVPCQTENLADNDTGSGSGSSGTGGSTDTGNDDPTDGDPYDGSQGGGSTDGDNTYDPNTGNNDGTNPDENTDQLDDCLQTDENGNCIENATMPLVKTNSIAELLKDVLDENPFLLLEIDCNQIQHWQALAQNVASQNILNKINNLPSTFFNDFEIQSLEDANGTVVNMDYFPVKVTTLPTNPNTGQQFTSDEFLDYFRRNINAFTEGGGTTFEPYCENVSPSICQQETDLWNSNDPTGALVYLDIISDDGVVICSEFHHDYWYFMTMNAPYAGNHPVSGTRQFGYEVNSDGSYNFFVRGVDRFNSFIQSDVAETFSGVDPFLAADVMWYAFQNNMNAFVNNNGGNSTIGTSIKNRPDWNKVKDVLLGNRPISDLGCD